MGVDVAFLLNVLYKLPPKAPNKTELPTESNIRESKPRLAVIRP
jgi:hypothetical protein